MTPNVQLAAPSDRPIVRSLLAEARLPVEDLDSGSPLTFLVARRSSQLIGAIGLERYGNVGLLRSLVVAPTHRRNGVGRGLVHALEFHANAGGIEELLLLTETAEPFFRALGYAAISRDRVPVDVTLSPLFQTLCPAAAVCMTKHLPRAH